MKLKSIIRTFEKYSMAAAFAEHGELEMAQKIVNSDDKTTAEKKEKKYTGTRTLKEQTV